MTLEVEVDRRLCIGCGACWTIAPKVFAERGGKADLAPAYRTGPGRGGIPEALEEDARRAAAACPVAAIKIYKS